MHSEPQRKGQRPFIPDWQLQAVHALVFCSDVSGFVHWLAQGEDEQAIFSGVAVVVALYAVFVRGTSGCYPQLVLWNFSTPEPLFHDFECDWPIHPRQRSELCSGPPNTRSGFPRQ